MPRRRANNEGSVYQDSRGVWRAVVTVHNPDGTITRRYLSGKTKRDAQRKLTDHRAAVAAGAPAQPDRITVGEYLDRWLTDSAALRVRPSSMTMYRWAVNHIKKRLGGTRLVDLRRTQVQQMVAALSTEYQPKSVRCIISVLYSALHRARLDGAIPQNPAEGVDLPRMVKRETVILTPAQIVTLLAHVRECSVNDALLYELLITTGVRISEALGLTWSALDLETGVVHVRQRLDWRPGQAPALAELKTASSRRRIPLLPAVRDGLRAYRDELAPAPGDYVFAREGRPQRPSAIWSRLRLYLKGCGLPPMTLHALRHTYATLMLTAGVDLKTTSGLLGHGDIGITANVYTHLVDPLRNDAAARLAALLAPENEPE